MEKAKKIFIITGEYSGDKHAACVVEELKKIAPDIIVEGVGESNLEAQGVKLLFDHKKMGKVGLTPRTIIEHLNLGIKIVDYLKNDFKPDLVLLVDYGAFNLQISKHLKKAGIKTFYFIPPQVWASRKHRLKTIKKNIDKVLTIFPFEKKLYDEYDIKSEYVGHPLVSEISQMNNREEFFRENGLDLNKKLIGVFPGSRMFEIHFLFKIFENAVKMIEKSRDDVQFVFSKAKSLPQNAFRTNYKTLNDSNQELLAYSDALILASGTVALEACLYETPMTIAYRGPLFFYLIYLLVRCIKRACLVNIITDKDYVKENLMFDCTSQNIASEINQILDNEQKREYLLSGLREAKELLGTTNCTKKAADIIYKELMGEDNG